jgi:TPR repeat protein
VKLQLKTFAILLVSTTVNGAETPFRHEPLPNPILTQFEAEYSGKQELDVATREMGQPGEYEFWEVAALLRDGKWKRREVDRLLNESGELGFGPAYAMLADFHRQGQYGFSKSRLKAERYDELAAEAGNGPSMVIRGEALYQKGGTRNIDEAEALLKRAVSAEANFYMGPPDPAFYNLGNPEVSGVPREVEPVISGSFSQKNFAIGYAYYYLGMIARQREAYAVAIAHFEDALDLGYDGNDGNNLAALQLAMAYAFGDGVEKDLGRSREYMDLFRRLTERSVELQRMQLAENNLIARLLYQRFGARIGDEVSREQSRMEAMIATQFADEKSEFFDPEEAVLWYAFAIEQDLPWAKRSLAEFYLVEGYSTYSPEKSFALYREMYESDPVPLIGFNLGVCYAAGFGVEADPEKGRELFGKYAENDLGARLALTGERVFEKPLTLDEIHDLEAAYAKKDDPLALALLGNRYTKGIGVGKDMERGLSLLRNSVIRDSAIGAFFLGSIHYQEGGKEYVSRAIRQIGNSYRRGGLVCIPFLVTLRNATYHSLKAKDLEPLNVFERSGAIPDSTGFEKTAAFYEEQEQLLETFLSRFPENAYARRLLGDTCVEYAKLENGVPDERKAALMERAIDAFESVVEKENEDGYYRLGQLYFEGELVETDYERARDYFEKAAEEEHAAANYYLGEIHRRGLGVDVDHDQAVEYYSFSGLYPSSGMERVLDSMTFLIGYFTEGEVMPVDPQRAELWVNILYDYATNDYGYFYVDIENRYRETLRRGMNWVADAKLENGDPETARRIFQVVAYQWEEDNIKGYARARLAELLYTGRGGRPSISNGDLYLYQAFEQDHPAAYRVAALYHKGAGDPKRAVRYLRKAVQLGEAEGMFDYGLYRWIGYGVGADREIAMRLFQKAANRGSVRAMVTLAAAGLLEIDGAPDLEESLSLADQADMHGHPLARKIASLIRRKLDGSSAGPAFSDELACLGLH